MPDQTQDQFDAEIGGQKLSIRSANLNTVATIVTMILVSLICMFMWNHATDTRDGGRELAAAIKDMTQAAREQNCLISLPQDQRERNAEICKRITR